MKNLLRAGALALVCAVMFAAPSHSQTASCGVFDAAGTCVPQAVEPPYRTGALVTPGATALALPGRIVVTTCTGAGNVVIVHKDGTTVTVTVSTGTSYWPEEAVQIATSGTTATCSYWIER